MKRFILSLAAVLFLVGGSPAQSKYSNDKCRGLDQKVVALISQYKELRNRRRHLPQGTFDNDLDRDGGKLHEVLFSLGVELGHPPNMKETIVGCLGEPDAIKKSGQMVNFLDIYHRELEKAGRKAEERKDTEYLIYFWRGWHDFTFFISEDGVIVDHGWWFAYE